MQGVKTGLLCVFRVTGAHGAEDAMVAEYAMAFGQRGWCGEKESSAAAHPREKAGAASGVPDFAGKC